MTPVSVFWLIVALLVGEYLLKHPFGTLALAVLLLVIFHIVRARSHVQ